MNLAIVVGVRPHFVKLSALYPWLIRHHSVAVIHTGQHFDFEMSRIFFRELELPKPDYNLGIGAGTHAEQTGTALIGLDRVLTDHSPDCVLVIGDANSSLAGALTAVKLGILVGHVEAGARNYDLSMPEEVNRVAIDSIASLFFCPTRHAIDNLKERGVEDNLFFVGDLLLDCVRVNLPVAGERSSALTKFGLTRKDYIVATIHRARNTETPDRLRGIVQALRALDKRMIVPLHPRTRNALLRFDLMDLLAEAKNVTVTAPQSYLDTLWLLKNAHLVLTDSNGLQREAFFVGTPCLILRDSTEYPETVEAGCAVLVGADRDRILQAVSNNLFASPLSFDPSLFGDGRAGERISSILTDLDSASTDL